MRENQPHPLGFITGDEMLRQYLEDLNKPLPRNWPRLTADGQAISLLRSRDGENSEDIYDLTLAEIPTPLHLLKWIVHLSEKNWMDAERLGVFVHLVTQAKDWPMPG